MARATGHDDTPAPGEWSTRDLASTYPDVVAWWHPADDLPAAWAHQPRTVFLPAGPAPGSEVEREGSAGETDVRRRDSAAVRAACSCGWRGPSVAITQQSSRHRAADIDGEAETLQRRRLQGAWEAHLGEVVPTLALHRHMPHVRYLDAELAGAVAHARHHETSWAAVAAACSGRGAEVVMSRQAAQQRWARSAAVLDTPGNRARMPVVTGWPGLPGWAHPAAGLDAAAAQAHQPRTVWVQRSGGEADRRTRSSTGLRPACRCGWRGAPRAVPDEGSSGMPDAIAGLERGFGPDWGRHLYTAAATLRVREVLDLMAGVHADLEDAVAHARRGRASWQEIADVVGIRRQSAHQRWRHLDTSPAGSSTAKATSEAPTSAGAPGGAATDSPVGGPASGPVARRERVRTVPPLLRPPTAEGHRPHSAPREPVAAVGR